MSILQISGSILLLSFYGSYFAKAIILRRQGITADRMGRGVKSEQTASIEKILRVITFSIAAVQLFSLFAADEGYLIFHAEVVRLMGLIIASMGTGIFITAMITMKNSWRAGVDASQKTSLIRHGIYRVSRNPAFLGFDVFYIGITLAFSNLILVAFSLFCIGMLHLQILEEEKFLSSVFGQEYLEYKDATARYFLW